jgi:ppGpp synthetase/RelA/SpoT-type nucleotidyltranferase
MDYLHIAVLVLAAIVTAVWSLPRVKHFIEGVHQTRLDRLWEFAEEAVSETYHSYTAERKRANEDGKITPEEAAKARAKALETLEGKLKRRAPKLLEHYGTEALQWMVQKVYGVVKGYVE